MIDDERLEDELEVFYREAPSTQPDQARLARDVFAAIRHEPERRGGSWRIRHRAADRLDASDPALGPASMPASDVRITTNTRRTWTMFSPAKAIIFGALAFALGGVLLIAQPFDERGVSSPGAAIDAEAAFVTGTIGWAPECRDAPSVMEDGVVVQISRSCAPRTVESDDARLAGTSVVSWNRSIHRTADGRTYSVRSQIEDIRGDGGGWVCRADAVPDRGLGGFYVYQLQGSDLYQCRGDGDNAGLMALLVVTTGAGDPDTFEGLIFPGDLPPAAELPPTK